MANALDRRRFLQSSMSLATAASVGGLQASAQESVRTTLRSTVATGSRGVVATVHPLASQAAIRAFDRGGNAVDAAIAASLMLSVVDGFNSGIGGGCLAMLRTSDGKTHAIDGREKAPARATPEMFYRNGRPEPTLSQMGPLAVGVPGLLAALHRLAEQHGKLQWNEALEDAATVAEDGFKIDSNYASRLASAASRLKRFPESARILLDPAGNPWTAGHRLQQPDLARTLRKVSEQGVEWFYEGEFAARLAEFMAAEGGIIDAKDLASYNTAAREPIQTDYRRNQVFGFPPPSSGGIHIAQMLEMLKGFDVAQIFGDSEAQGRHLLLEVMKRAMADRAYWLGDSDFVSVPRGLLDQQYLKERASSIDLDRATKIESHGQPPRADVDLFGKGGHTTHLTTADSQGNVVALTQTVNTTFGSKMIATDTGVVLNNELDDFSIAPGVRNAFGLLGSDSNLIAPGKRPLSSMSPTIVLDAQGDPLLSCGAAGGPKIITTVLQVLVRVLDLGQTVEQAIAAPRAHHQWSPDKAVCEKKMDKEVLEQLARWGHQVEQIGSAAVAQGLHINHGTLTAASDPRVPSSAMGI